MSQTDRRKWNKSNKNLNLEYPEVSQEIQKRLDDYLTNLHVQNHMSKMLNEKDPKEVELSQKESGFNLYVNGAHRPPERLLPRNLISSSSSKNKKQLTNFTPNFIPKLHIRKDNNKNKEEDRCKSAPGNKRKQWLMSSITIKTMDGFDIKLCAPGSVTERTNNKNAEHYSDDFITDSSDDEFKASGLKNNCNDPSSNLIKSVKFSSSNSSIESDEDSSQQKRFQKTKKKCLKLSKADVKFLRQSINKNSLSLSEDSLEDDMEIDCSRLEKTPRDNKLESDKDDHQNTVNNSCFDKNSENGVNNKCNVILQNIGNLDVSERKTLYKFLKSVDEFQFN